ncbi:MAG: hypothetical protein BMS9Abin20_1084 [Acidimicrobiia bacterium]|nr:MAG: hypothetical protein BMS9Abin20_1084 [Acidimicrobiia bacterium]
MRTAIEPIQVGRGPVRRHDARVRQFSRDHLLLERLDTLVVDDDQARAIVVSSCVLLGVNAPRLKFHGRRSMYTGATERPRSAWVDLLGEDEVERRELLGWGAMPRSGAIRLGRRTTLMTIAHELGHYIVFCVDPSGTPAHGKQWVARFDDAAAAVVAVVDASALSA